MSAFWLVQRSPPSTASPHPQTQARAACEFAGATSGLSCPGPWSKHGVIAAFKHAVDCDKAQNMLPGATRPMGSSARRPPPMGPRRKAAERECDQVSHPAHLIASMELGTNLLQEKLAFLHVLAPFLPSFIFTRARAAAVSTVGPIRIRLCTSPNSRCKPVGAKSLRACVGIQHAPVGRVMAPLGPTSEQRRCCPIIRHHTAHATWCQALYDVGRVWVGDFR